MPFRIPLSRALILLLLALLLAATACGGAEDATDAGRAASEVIANSTESATDDTAAEVAADESAQPASEPAAANTAEATDDVAVEAATTEEVCTTQVIEDEYGFEIEIELCESDAAASTAVPVESDPESLGWVTEHARRVLLTNDFCEEGHDLGDSARAIVAEEAVPEAGKGLVRDLTILAGQSAGACTNEADWATFINTGVDHITAAGPALGDALGTAFDSSTIGAVDAGALNTAQRAVSAVDALYQVTDTPAAFTPSQNWLNRPHRTVVEDALRAGSAAADDRRWVTLVGTSILQSGIDTNALVNQSGAADLSVINMGIPGFRIQGSAAFIDQQLADVAPTSSVVWSLPPRFFFENGCDAGPGEKLPEILSTTSTFFPKAPWLPTPSVLTVATEVAGVEATESANGIGGTRPQPGDVAAAVAEDIDDVTRKLASATYCDATMEQVAKVTAQATSDGKPVTWLLPPVYPEMRELPGWADFENQVVAELEQRAATAGVELLDHRDVVPADQFRDGHHLTVEGQATWTSSLATSLG